ncbi:hypothetical protein [Chroococcidiopsis cubana]|nr:hypothetical protein [Chroococcidiopsis cubana]
MINLSTGLLLDLRCLVGGSPTTPRSVQLIALVARDRTVSAFDAER